MTRRHVFLALSVLPLALLLVIGFGSGNKKASAKGIVTVAGKPLPMGEVIFMGDDGKPVPASIGPKGEYTMVGAPVGTVKAAVTFVSIDMNMNKHPGMKGAP